MFRYGDKIREHHYKERSLFFRVIMSLCYPGIGAGRSRIGGTIRSRNGGASRFYIIVLRQCHFPILWGTAGDHRIPLHGHMAAHGNGHIRRVSVCPDAPVSIIIVCIARLFRPATLSQYRIREQYLVINYPASLHRCLRYHELYTFPVHLCLPHKPLHDKPC